MTRDLCNRAMLSLGYDLLTRRSELAAPHSSDVELKGDGTLRGIIRCSKVETVGIGRITFSPTRSAKLARKWPD